MEVRTVTPIITIIDDDDDRRQAMARAFDGRAIVQVAYTDSRTLDLRLETGVGAELSKLEDSLILFRHFGDRDIEPDLAAKLKIYYGGNGGEDRRYSPDEEGGEERIWRPIGSEAGALSADEGIELIRYAMGLSPRPACLEKGIKFEILTTFLTLCVGYLGVHAEWENGKVKPAEAGPALEQMGWIKLTGDGGAEPLIRLIGLSDKRGDVCKAEWWLKPFGLKPIGTDNEGDEGWTEFEQKIEKEWGGDMPETFSAMVKELKTGREFVGDITLENQKIITFSSAIAQIYQTISKRVG